MQRQDDPPCLKLRLGDSSSDPASLPLPRGWRRHQPVHSLPHPFWLSPLSSPLCLLRHETALCRGLPQAAPGPEPCYTEVRSSALETPEKE